jgi:hypothetical protein
MKCKVNIVEQTMDEEETEHLIEELEAATQSLILSERTSVSKNPSKSHSSQKFFSIANGTQVNSNRNQKIGRWGEEFTLNWLSKYMQRVVRFIKINDYHDDLITALEYQNLNNNEMGFLPK